MAQMSYFTQNVVTLHKKYFIDSNQQGQSLVEKNQGTKSSYTTTR